MNDGWYGALKETIQQQQNQLVWVSEGKVRFTVYPRIAYHKWVRMHLRVHTFNFRLCVHAAQALRKTMQFDRPWWLATV